MNYFTNGGKESSYYPFYYEWNAAAATDKALQAEVEARFFDTLEVGDLIVVTRGTAKGGYGHVMMYVGNGIVAHSSGSTRSGDTEYYEATIRYMNIRGYLFDPTASNYLFNETTSSSSVYQTCIVRPLSSYKGQIPENTLNRMENLEGILSEKLSSHPEGMTANKGEEVTFTYKINNTGKTVKTLTVTDVVPANATLKYADGAVVDGNDLSWTVTVEPNETVTVSYTVIATGENGSYIYSDAGKVGGVRHTCPKVYIAPTLTAADQQAILDAVAYYRSNNTNALTSFALINAIYEKAGLEAPFVDADGNDVTSAALRASLFKTSSAYSNMWELNTSSEYYDMVIPTLYGGGKYYTKNYYSSTNKTSSDRSRLPREQALCFGDILVVRFSSSDALYMYVGSEHLINLNASLSNDSNYAAYHRLQRMLSVGNYYAILRPSMGGDITIEDKYTVTFDSKGGSEVGSVRISASGVSVSEPAEPSRAQHNFLGWYLNGEKYDFSSVVSSDITLVARWESLIEDTEVF